MTVTLKNLSTSQEAGVNEVFSIATDEDALLTATVTNADGTPAPGRLISATFLDGTCQFSGTTDGNIVTDSNGEATIQFQLIPGVTETAETLTVTSDLPAESTDTAPSVSINFNILPTNSAGSIEFISATPTLIGLSGNSSSTLPSQSILEFVVKDNQGFPVYAQEVNFSLTTQLGGLSLEPASAPTDIEGKVSVVVKAGVVPTSVQVSAVVETTTMSTLSNELILSTGFPDQNSFSISTETFNPEAMYYDGEVVNVTIRAGDINNNPVPDNTAIYFTTEGGVIENSCLTQNGVCSVEWRSQAPRPVDGRVTILAYTQGEESFEDLNGTGLYEADTDYLLTDLPEAFLDTNNDGFHGLLERFVDFNNDSLYTNGNGIYNGTLCKTDSVDCSSDLVHVRDDIMIVMAESYADITFDPSEDIVFQNSTAATTIAITVSGRNTWNAMPNETTVEVTAPENAEIKGDSSFTINNTTAPQTFYVTLAAANSEETTITDALIVEVTTPKNNFSTAKLNVTTPPAPVEE